MIASEVSTDRQDSVLLHLSKPYLRKQTFYLIQCPGIPVKLCSDQWSSSQINCINGMMINKLLSYSEYLCIIICIFSATKVLCDWKWFSTKHSREKFTRCANGSDPQHKMHPERRFRNKVYATYGHDVQPFFFFFYTLAGVLVTPWTWGQRLLRCKQLTPIYKCQRFSRQDQIPSLYWAQPDPLWQRLPRGCRPYRNANCLGPKENSG